MGGWWFGWFAWPLLVLIGVSALGYLGYWLVTDRRSRPIPPEVSSAPPEIAEE